MDRDAIERHPGGGKFSDVHSTAPIVVGIHRPREEKGRSLILQAHVDVVPPGPADLWTHPAFDPVISGDWLYGRVEVRAMLPAGKGLWPAIWMLPTDSKYGGWPACGEIDIMENVGFMPDSVFGSVHTKRFNHTIGTGFTVGHYMDDEYKVFHIYAVDWDAGHIRFSIDGNVYAVFRNTSQGFEEWPFDQAFHCILNLAVGGNWGGKYGVDDKNFPATLLVDYVRVYQTTP